MMQTLSGCADLMQAEDLEQGLYAVLARHGTS